MLVSGFLVKGSLLIVDSLLVVFLLIFVITIFRGLDISCGCFLFLYKPAKAPYHTVQEAAFYCWSASACRSTMRAVTSASHDAVYGISRLNATGKARQFSSHGASSIGFGLFFGLIILSEAFAAAGSVKWHSYQEGVALGKDQNKKVFVNFFADWCTYCKQMDNETFNDSAVGAYLNKNFIAVKVDADRETQLASEYHVQGLPASTFIAEDGALIGSQPGFIAPDQMMPLLHYIHSDSYKTMSFEKFLEASGN
jgi:thioredoxin-related protein